MTTVREGDPLETAIRSIVENSIMDGRIRLDEDGATALNRIIEGMLRTARGYRGPTPLESEDVQEALVLLRLRLPEELYEVASITEGIIGRREVLAIANAICPLPPICRGPAE